MVLSGCASLGASGPQSAKVESGVSKKLDGAQIALVDLTDNVARRVIASRQGETFAQVFGDDPAGVQMIGAGDTLDISIWEAPPAALFGAVGGGMAVSSVPILAPEVIQNSSLPAQMVAEDGTIRIPFVGAVQAAGLSVQQLERAIVARLTGKAHLPQVMVRVAGNRSSSVTVVGDVRTNAPVPLTAKGERVLDALASVGGVSQPTGKVTLRLTRGGRSVSQPLESVLLDPVQNIHLLPGDVLTALYQPYTFTALGAVASNSEVPFEGTGFTLAQALGRVGGLLDNRANRRGVFIFRLEDPAVMDPAALTGRRLTPDGRLPVIYKLDLNDPGSFFVAQGFPIRNGDVLYVSNAPLADLQKFVSIVSSMAYSIIGISNAVK
ncbi:polysaccharide export outer membrane protein [Novosphingobium mathurense]|uniref:Polysaccharide export outer membrane protein n=1 Tax=Novosphingobium mathurense TaxID=428990 RepID=A0A1U6ITS2_9SPHN|nr:polysaccharide export outer membrane protein [Novosphingobium mathurense]